MQQFWQNQDELKPKDSDEDEEENSVRNNSFKKTFNKLEITTSKEMETSNYMLLNTPEIYPKNSPFHGIAYQLKLLMLFILNSLDKTTPFRIATEMTAADKFNDIVLHYIEKDKPVYRLIQVKHKQDHNKVINISDLLAEAKDDDYSLQKYFSSYTKIQQNKKFKNEELQDFVIYTNINFDTELVKYFELVENEDSILQDKNVTSKRYKLKLDDFPKKKELIINLKNSSDFNILANKLVNHLITKQTLDYKDILKSYYTELSNKVIDIKNAQFKTLDIGKTKNVKKYVATFHESFLNRDLKEKELEYFRNLLLEVYAQKLKIQNFNQNTLLEELSKKEFILSKNFKINEMENSDQDNTTKTDASKQTDLHLTANKIVTDEHIELFLNKLLFVVNQPNEGQLDDIIMEKLRNEFNNTEIKYVYTRFMFEVFDWMKGRDGIFRTQVCLKETFENLKKEIYGEIIFDVKPPVKSFSGRKQELLELFDTMDRGYGKMCILSQIKSISGLGGIGKTELARQYIKEIINKHSNTSILWINAENEKSLERSFRNLAKDNRIRIPTEDIDGNKKSIKNLVSEIYRFFSKRKCIFVFDNADRGEYLHNFLPLETSLVETLKPNILITSRIAREYWKRWGIEDGITLNVFTDDEAINFVQEVLQGTNETEEDIMKKLAVDLLHNFPLALQQAISHIQEQNDWLQRNSNAVYTISNYIKDFKKKKEQLLSYEIYNSIDNDYTKTTFTTWKITLDKIKNHEQHGKLALEILCIMAYIAPTNIPFDIFSNLLPEPEKDYQCAIDLLNRYSMVKQKQGKVDVHALVQEVTRLELKRRNEESHVIEVTFSLLKKCHQDKYTEEYFKTKEILPHLEAFLTHRDKFKRDFANDLLQQIHYAHCVLGNPNSQKQVLEDILEIQINNYLKEESVYELKSNHVQEEIKDHQKIFTALAILEKQNNEDCFAEIGVTLYHLTNAYAALGKHEIQKVLLEKSLPLLEKVNDNIIYALSLHSLGNCYGEYGNYVKKKNLQKCALKLLETYFGAEHIKVASVLDDLGSAYGALGDHRRQKQLQKRALKIKEQKNGYEHISLATTQSNLGNAYGALGNYQKQKELQMKALLIKERHYGHDHVEIAYTLDSLASAYRALHEYETQKELLKRALTIKLNHYSEEHIKVATTEYYLGNAFGDLGNHHKQIELLEKAVLVYERHYNKDHINISFILSDLGVAYGATKDYNKQVVLQSRALDMQLKYYSDNTNIKIATTKFNLGNAYGGLRNYVKQIQLQEDALNITQKHLGREHIELAYILNSLGNAYGSLNKHFEQKTYQKRALSIQSKFYGDQINTDIASTMYNLSIAYRSLNKPDKQIKLQEEALQYLENSNADEIKIAILLEDLANAYGIRGDSLKQIELLEKALPILEQNYNDKEFAGTLYNLGNAYGKIDDYHKQRDILEKTLELQIKCYGEKHIEVARTLYSIGTVYGAFEDYQLQKDLQEKALPILEKHHGNESIVIGRVLINIGNAYQSLNDSYNQSLFHEKALFILDKYYGDNDNIEVAIILVNLGNAYGSLGNYGRQRDLQERALPILKKYYGDQNSKVGITLFNLGNAYRALLNYNKQIEVQEEALRIDEKEYGPDSFEIVSTLLCLADAYGDIGQTHKQMDLLERVLSIEKKHYGENHIKIVKTLNQLDQIYKNLKDQRNRIRVLENVLAIEEKQYDTKNFYLGRTMHILGNAHGAFGNHFKQIDLQERALVILNKCEESSAELPLLLQNLGIAYGAIGDFESQKDLFEKVLKIKEKEYGDEHIETGRILQNLGNTYFNLSDHVKQMTVLERALPIFKRFGNEVDVTRVLNNLSNASRILGNYEKHVAFRKEALAMVDRKHSSNLNLHKH